MSPTFPQRETARFLRTLRVTTQTALALDDLQRGRSQTRPATAFAALAARGADEWRFPAAGLMSSDGLVLARLLRQAQDTQVLELQAQGLAGLSTYANRSARVLLGAHFAAEGLFDRDGRLHIVLDDEAIGDADLSKFELQLLDGAL